MNESEEFREMLKKQTEIFAKIYELMVLWMKDDIRQHEERLEVLTDKKLLT